MSDRTESHSPLRTVVIGAGTFGASIIEQAAYVPALSLCAVADSNIQLAHDAYQLAGIPSERVRTCQSPSEARQALESGQYIVTRFADILFELPIDVIVEATGSPEAGAAHAMRAIEYGKHVAMVTKEADAAVGPILKVRADRAGVIYTPVDGDQHGLLIDLVRWARAVGLEILCAGKALDSELTIQPPGNSFSYWGKSSPLTEAQSRDFAPHFPAPFSAPFDAMLASRAHRLGPIAGAKPWDVVELTIAANATGLTPDVPAAHCPSLWANEIPSVLCPKEFGGVLKRAGSIDAVQLIRQPHEVTFGGGVFIVVGCQTKFMARVLAGGGLMCNRDATAALIIRPHHLLGIEAITSILSCGRGESVMKTMDYRPRFDVVYRTTRAMSCGETIGGDHSPDVTAEMLPAARLSPGAPLPAALAQNNLLRCDVPAGQIICGGMVESPGESTLWRLRQEQDAHFLNDPT